MKRTDRMTRKTLWLAAIAAVITIATSAVSLNRDHLTVTATTIPIATSSASDRGLHLSGNTYTANGQYDLAILSQTNPETQTREDFSVTPTAGLPLIESPDRTLAYTAIVRQRSQPDPLDATALTQLAIDTLQRGEGFIAGEAIELGSGRVRLPWTGMAEGEPVAGSAIAVQDGASVLMLVVSATGEGMDRLDAAIGLLSPSITLAKPEL